MTDTDTAANPAGKRERGAAKPIDTKDFLGMLTDARKLVAEFQRALKKVSPKMTMRDYMTLARINAGEAAQADADDAEGEGEGEAESQDSGRKSPKTRKGATASLQKAGLISTAGDGKAEVTDQGRKVLTDMDALLASVLSAMGGGKRGAATKGGGRNVPMALKAVKQSTRGSAGPAEGKGARRARRKAAKAEGGGGGATEPGELQQA